MDLTVRELLERYGPTLVLAAVLVLLVSLLAVGEDERRRLPALASTPAAPSAPAPPPTESQAALPATRTPVAAPEPRRMAAREGASAGGRAVRDSSSSRVAAPRPHDPQTSDAFASARCRSDGRMDGFSLYMPPCVPVFAGDNGGSTAQGVTREQILVVRFMSNVDPAAQALLSSIGADDGRAKNDDMDQTAVDYFNDHMETYRRQVVVKTYDATGPDDDETAMRRDAITIARQLRPFAVFYVPPSAPAPAFAEEIAANGIVCVCALSQGRSFYQRTAPYVWGLQPTLEEYYQVLAEYIGKRLAGRLAGHAGDLPPTLKTSVRRFGLVYLTGQKQTVDPGYEEARRYYEQELARYGVSLAGSVSYTFDLSRQQEQATNVITRMKEAGVSNLLCSCDSIYLIFLTNEATRQAYFPEWLITGSVAPVDTTFFGRLYNQAQWQHAFGVGTQPVTSTAASQPGYRAYYHMRPGARPGAAGKAVNYREGFIRMLFTGIDLAGPNLTPQTFARGMYGWPRTGGEPKFPLVYYTVASPVQVKDFTEVFWNARGRGPDEAGNEGVGVLMWAEGGRRYQPGQWERSEPRVFTPDGAVFTSASPSDSFPHDADGHRHPPAQRCRSCP